MVAKPDWVRPGTAGDDGKALFWNQATKSFVFGSAGGFTVGSSAIVCEVIGDPAYPLDGSAGVGWLQVDLAGSDISVDGGDPSIINLATSGWYSWGFAASFSNPSLPALLTALTVNWNIPVESAQQAQAARQVGMSFQFIDATQLPFEVVAPATLQFTIFGRPYTGGDTGGLADGYLCVTRFA